MSHVARVAIRRLRTGIVPSSELERLSVGLSRVKRVVTGALCALMEGRNEPVSLFVHGEWGSGKTHLLSYVRILANRRGIPSTGIILNARSAALTHPQHFYPDLVNNISVDSLLGFRGILLSLLGNKDNWTRIQAFAQTPFAGDLKQPLLAICEGWNTDDPVGLEDHPAWRIILGADLSWADYAYKRSVAISRISSLLFLFRAVGLGGLVVTLDELETIDQLWNIRSRISAYDVLGHLCRLTGAWCIFGVTDRFDGTISADIERGATEFDYISDNAKWFLRSWRRKAFNVITPPEMNINSARILAGSILATYKEAYPGYDVDHAVVERCIKDWSDNPNRNLRRLIRILIQNLDAGRGLTSCQKVNAGQ